jgi:hypothetical protein
VREKACPELDEGWEFGTLIEIFLCELRGFLRVLSGQKLCFAKIGTDKKADRTLRRV